MRNVFGTVFVGSVTILGVAGVSRADFIAGRDLLADVNNAAANSTTASNPNGVWSYGFQGASGPNALTGSVTLYNTVSFQANSTGQYTTSLAGEPRIQGFAISNGVPDTAVNVTNGDVVPSYGTTDTAIHAGEMFVHPGGANGAQTYTIVTWTAPSAGNYSVTNAFWRLTATASTDGIDAHVYVTHNAMTTDVVDGNATLGSGATFAPSLTGLTNLALNAGDTIRFYTGPYGTNVSTNSNNADHTAFNATIVPEPGSFCVLAVAASGLLARRRRP